MKELPRFLSFILLSLSSVIYYLLNFLEGFTQHKLSIYFYHIFSNKLNPVVEAGGIYFDAGSRIPFVRALTLFTKEPETISWIDSYIEVGDVLYDVGANVGVYSLYAAHSTPKTKVVAFEPEASNYSLLNKNIQLNNLDGQIMALNIALNDKNMISYLNLGGLRPGRSGHSFHESKDSNHRLFSPYFRQGVMGLSLDTLLRDYHLPFPNHIKIDVDGNEQKIIAGMKNILGDKRLKTVAIEANVGLSEHIKLKEMMSLNGFSLMENEEYINKEYMATGFLNLFFCR